MCSIQRPQSGVCFFFFSCFVLCFFLLLLSCIADYKKREDPIWSFDVFVVGSECAEWKHRGKSQTRKYWLCWNMYVKIKDYIHYRKESAACLTISVFLQITCLVSHRAECCYWWQQHLKGNLWLCVLFPNPNNTTSAWAFSFFTFYLKKQKPHSAFVLRRFPHHPLPASVVSEVPAPFCLSSELQTEQFQTDVCFHRSGSEMFSSAPECGH